MDVSKNGINLVKQFEGLELTAYKALPTEQYWTIGYGHYGPDVRQGEHITEQQAENFLYSDLRNSVNAVNTSVNVPLTQNQFDALVSFVYNVGVPAFNSSTLLKKLNAHDYVGASHEFALWIHSGGNVIQGLVNRRNAEQKLFNTGVPQSTIQNYTIRSGENLTVIAQRMGTTINTLKQLNPQIKNPDLVFAGQVIKVPVK